MPQEQTPNWQPISALPMIARMIDEMLEDAQEQYQTFQEVQDRPYVLNDAIVQKTIQVYTAQKEIERLGKQVEQLRAVLTDILSLADKLKEGTIEKILAKDDAELALEVLAGKWKIPE